MIALSPSPARVRHPARGSGWVVWLILPAGMAFACGSSASFSGRVSAAPTPEETTMLDDLVHHRTGGTSPLEAALIIGGARDPSELTSMVRSLDATLGRIVAGLPADPTARGRALLEALHAPSDGRPLLQRYDAGATTLYDVATTGRFNCVSATTLYLLGAARAGLDVRPVLLPSHARAVAVVGGRRVVVETTTRNGFDAPPSVSREALERARPKGARARVDLYADEKGTEVDWNALLAVTYGNLGIVAQDHGDAALASALLAREAALTPPAQAAVVRTQQVSLLTELATRALGERKWSEALSLSRRAADAAPDPASKRLTEQNIGAIASQELVAEEPQMSDAALATYAEPLRAYPGAYGDFRALVLTFQGGRRLRHGDVEGSAAALREAASVATSAEVRGQTGHNARLGEINRIATLSATDPEGAWAAWQRLGPADPALGATETEAARVIEENRAIRFSNDGACVELESVLGSAPGVRRPDTLRASCHARRGLALERQGDFKGAIDELRGAVRFDPGEPQHRKNLAVMMEKEIDRLVHGSHCDLAAPLVAEGRALDPSATFFDEAATFCRSR
jgi:tetratricopeptide (TPR) repeat protein